MLLAIDEVALVVVTNTASVDASSVIRAARIVARTAIVAAFVTETGLALLEPRIFAALQAGARVRIVTGDYRGFNSSSEGLALRVAWRGRGVRGQQTDVRLPDGAVWRFKFAKEFVNVARPVGTDRNRLADLMRGWFGPNAGHPGTRFEVQFSRSPDGWWSEPLRSQRFVAAGGQLVAHPSLRAAAGAGTDGQAGAPVEETVTLPFDGRTDGLFAVRAAVDSMAGGKNPIRDGDWLVMRWARGASPGSLEGQVALVETGDGHDTFVPAVTAPRS